MPVTDTSKKVKSVIDRRQNDGKWICAVPYGYIITNTKKYDHCHRSASGTGGADHIYPLQRRLGI